MAQTLVTQYETSDWTPLSVAPNAVTYNGNRSYSLTYPSVDYTSTLTPGQRLRTTRTVAAPTQCTSLNGTNQYYNRASASVNGMSFTDDFTVSAWVKLTSYAGLNTIVSRYNGTSGWSLQTVTDTGQIILVGFNAGASNNSYVQSYQSIPLNKWVHITAQLDMSAFTASTTTSYVMIDGVNVPAQVIRGGTNPTALLQAGDLQVGARIGSNNHWNGKIAQVAIFNAKVTQATIRGYISQGLAGNETSLISAYSFNNSINDLNTTNANNLTAQNSAVATNADSPFGGQAGGTISSTLDYGIIQSRSFSTNTTVVVQVPEGCAIPTSGGVGATHFSGLKIPSGFPSITDKWRFIAIYYGNTNNITGSIAGAWGKIASTDTSIPAGKWNLRTNAIITAYSSNAAAFNVQSQFSSVSPSASTSQEGEDVWRINSSTGSYLLARHRHFDYLDLSTATSFAFYCVINGGSGTQTAYLENGNKSYIVCENAYL